MQDGQSRSMFYPDRSEDDDVDLEIVVESESETEARTASLGVQRQLKGESYSSIKCFMANWTSDSDASGGHGAESEPPARKAEGKRPRGMLVPLEPPRSPRRKLVPCRSVRLLSLLLLGPLALCLE